jgi:hypothetical protein
MTERLRFIHPVQPSWQWPSNDLRRCTAIREQLGADLDDHITANGWTRTGDIHWAEVQPTDRDRELGADTPTVIEAIATVTRTTSHKPRRPPAT